jgi:hypothetical protein
MVKPRYFILVVLEFETGRRLTTAEAQQPVTPLSDYLFCESRFTGAAALGEGQHAPDLENLATDVDGLRRCPRADQVS